MSVACRFYNTSGGCRYGDYCRYSHVNTQLCRYFNSSSGCRYGTGCFYKHEIHPPQHHTNDTPSNTMEYSESQTIQRILHQQTGDYSNNINTKTQSSENYKSSNNKSSGLPNIGISEKCNDDKKLYSFDPSQININHIHHKKQKEEDRKTLIGQFYSPLKLDYIPMSDLSETERCECSKMLKLRGNQMYSKKQYIKAIEYYEKAIILLDCSYFKNKQTLNEDTNILLSILLSNTAQCWLSLYKKKENTENISCLLFALNCAQMSLWINCSNNKAFCRKIKCLYKLGLFEAGDFLMEQRKNINNDLQKEKLNNSQKYAEIEKYKKILSDTTNCTQIANNKWDESKWKYLLLSISELIRTNKWSITDCILWLKTVINDIIDQSMHHHLLPSNLYRKNETNQFRVYCLSFISIILSYKPKDIATYFIEFTDSKNVSDEEWEDYADKVNHIEMNNKLWISQRFWSVIVENILNEMDWDKDIVDALKKKTLIYTQIINMDQRFSKWKQFYNSDQLRLKNKTVSVENNILPFDGRLTPLPKRNKRRNMETLSLGDDDLLNIHAIATSRKQLDVIQEIEENVFHFKYAEFSWLHEFAKCACYKTCEFVVSLGFDVNITDQGKYDENRSYYSSVTPIDYALQHLMKNRKPSIFMIGVTNIQKINLQKVIRKLREMGGKRICELTNKCNSSKETKLFNKIINYVDIEKHFYSNNMSYNELKDKLILYGAQSGQKTFGVKESFDSFQIRLAIKDFQKMKIPNNMIQKLINEGIRPWDYGGNIIEECDSDSDVCDDYLF